MNATDAALGGVVVEAGWYDGDGEATDPAVTARVRRLIPALVTAGAAQPRFYPMLDGGISAEWTTGHTEIGLAFEPSGRLVYCSANIRTGHATWKAFDDDDPKPIVRRLKRAASLYPKADKP